MDCNPFKSKGNTSLILCIQNIYCALGQESANILCKRTGNKYFLDRIVFVATTQLCCNMKAAINSKSVNEHVCVPVKLYLQKQAIGQIELVRSSLPTHGTITEMTVIKTVLTGDS